jgi:hypothetical protein
MIYYHRVGLEFSISFQVLLYIDMALFACDVMVCDDDISSPRLKTGLMLTMFFGHLGLAENRGIAWLTIQSRPTGTHDARVTSSRLASADPWPRRCGSTLSRWGVSASG